MPGGDGSAQRETEAGAAGAARARRFPPVEAVEHPLPVLRRDSVPRVGDLEPDAPRPPTHRQAPARRSPRPARRHSSRLYCTALARTFSMTRASRPGCAYATSRSRPLVRDGDAARRGVGDATRVQAASTRSRIDTSCAPRSPDCSSARASSISWPATRRQPVDLLAAAAATSRGTPPARGRASARRRSPRPSP